LGGLVTSTVLNLCLMPALYLAFGRVGRRPEDEDEGLASRSLERHWPPHKSQPALAAASMPAHAAD
jgi:hypothetical protein